MNITQLLFLPFFTYQQHCQTRNFLVIFILGLGGNHRDSSCLYYFHFILRIWEGNQRKKTTTSLKFNFTSPSHQGLFIEEVEKQGVKNPDCNPKPLYNIAAVGFGECVWGGWGALLLKLPFLCHFCPLRVIGNDLDQMIRSAWNMKILPSNPSYWLQE